jgi:hypothetical protein
VLRESGSQEEMGVLNSRVGDRDAREEYESFNNRNENCARAETRQAIIGPDL